MNISKTRVSPRVISQAISVLTDYYSSDRKTFEPETIDFAKFLYDDNTPGAILIPGYTRVDLEYLLKQCGKDKIVNFVYQYAEAMKHLSYRKFIELFDPMFNDDGIVELKIRGKMREFAPIDLNFEGVHFDFIRDPKYFEDNGFELLGNIDDFKPYTIYFKWKKEEWVVSKAEKDKTHFFNEISLS